MNGAMFERYTETARRSLFFARYEASVLGSRSIGTEHLLLGILKQPDALVTHLLGTAAVAAESLRQHTARACTRREPVDTSVEIPFSRDAKQVLHHTAEEAERLLHRHIGTEHLLLGLLRLERGLAWDVLRGQGLRLAPVREALVLHVSATSPPPPEVEGMLAEVKGALAAILPGGAPRPHPPGPVYVMTTLDGPSPGRRTSAVNAGGGFFTSVSAVGFSSRADHPTDRGTRSIGLISMSGTTLPQFAIALEEFLKAPVMVDESLLATTFDIEFQGEYDNPEALIAALREQLGLVLTRNVT
jgi:hypothetical protein